MVNKRAKFFISPYSTSIVFFMMLASFNAFAELGVYPHVYKAEPSYSKAKGQLEKMIVKYMCVGEYDGESYPCTIESRLLGIKDSESIPRFEINNMITGIPRFTCTNTTNLNVEELFIYGGHLHNQAAREYTFGSTKYLLDDKDLPTAERYIVEGQTKTNVASELVYETPSRAGIYTALTTLTAPDHPNPSWRFIFRDGFSVNSEYDRHIIRVEGLSRIPGCPDDKAITGQKYILYRGDTIPHPEAHWAATKTSEFAIKLANYVNKKHKKTMSYNDFSLPLGGFHDVNGSNKYHQTHRSGRDIDINGGRMSYVCKTTNFDDGHYYVHKAMIRLVGKGSIVAGTTKVHPNLDCYKSGNNMHIDVSEGR